MEIIERESEQIHKQKDEREMKIDPILALEIEPQSEKNGDRHPAQVEDSGKEVHELARMQRKKLVWRKSTGCGDYTENVLLVFIEIPDVNGFTS